MDTINKQYIIDENNKKIGVQLDLKTFKQIEEVMENYALFLLMKEDGEDKLLGLEDAQEYYAKLEKED